MTQCPHCKANLECTKEKPTVTCSCGGTTIIKTESKPKPKKIIEANPPR